MATNVTHPGWMIVHGVRLEIVERGQGRPILWLHGEEGLDPGAQFLDLLAAHGSVLAPSHPGFGRSPDVASIDTVDDLSYLYLDVLAERNLRDVTVVGSSLGGWIAAEMAVKCSDRFSGLVLVAPLGIKVGDRETRDIPDIFALPPDEVARLQYRDPAKMAVDHGKLSDDQLTVIARNREATALYAWEPYFHNPKLRQWLHRITLPTLLLWGADDRFVTASYYGDAFRTAIPGARFETIDRAGHFPHLEEPASLVERIRGFIGERKA
jgi:pimeloyl-ACP methyl ester carboxylesterase